MRHGTRCVISNYVCACVFKLIGTCGPSFHWDHSVWWSAIWPKMLSKLLLGRKVPIVKGKFSLVSQQEEKVNPYLPMHSCCDENNIHTCCLRLLFFPP